MSQNCDFSFSDIFDDELLLLSDEERRTGLFDRITKRWKGNVSDYENSAEKLRLLMEAYYPLNYGMWMLRWGKCWYCKSKSQLLLLCERCLTLSCYHCMLIEEDNNEWTCKNCQGFVWKFSSDSMVLIQEFGGSVLMKIPLWSNYGPRFKDYNKKMKALNDTNNYLKQYFFF